MNSGFLTAIDAKTGSTIAGFGENGKLDVRVGLHRDVSSVRPLQTGNPGRIFENLIIMSLPAGWASDELYLSDLKGKLTNLPIYKLIGGAWKTAIPFYASIGGNGDRSVDGRSLGKRPRPGDNREAVQRRIERFDAGQLRTGDLDRRQGPAAYGGGNPQCRPGEPWRLRRRVGWRFHG